MCMYFINVKNSQNEFVNTGFLFQNTYYVDDSIQEGLPIASFCSVASGTSKCRQHGVEQATLHKAGKTLAKASGVIYTTSPKDMYGRRDDFTNEVMLYPYGQRQDQAIGLLKKCVIEIGDGTKKHVFRTVDEVLLESGSVTTNNKVTITSDTPVKYGDKIELIDTGASNASSIHHIIAVSGKEITFTPNATVTGPVKVIAKCQMDDPVYLNNAPVHKKGIYEKMEDLPFTTVRTTTRGEIDQLVGYIESPLAIRIDLNLDNNPQKVK